MLKWLNKLEPCSLGHCVQEDLGLSESTYELCYNAACSLIGRGQLAQAMKKLQEAEGQGSFHFEFSTKSNDTGLQTFTSPLSPQLITKEC